MGLWKHLTLWFRAVLGALMHQGCSEEALGCSLVLCSILEDCWISETKSFAHKLLTQLSALERGIETLVCEITI